MHGFRTRNRARARVKRANLSVCATARRHAHLMYVFVAAPKATEINGWESTKTVSTFAFAPCPQNTAKVKGTQSYIRTMKRK